MAYGIRVYQDGVQDAAQSVVAFPVDKPSEVSEIFTFDNLFIRAAANHGGSFYMVHCEDKLLASSLWKLDLTTEKLTKVCDYDYDSKGSNLMVMDMTYDTATNRLYALAYDVEGAVVDDDGEGIDIPFGLFWIDPETGEAHDVGYQEFMALATIAADPEGYLYALDYTGSLWTLNKNNGRPGDPVCETETALSLLQSMTFDSKGKLYWAGFNSTDDGASASSWFSTFTFKEDCVEYDKVGNIGASSEIIGLWIDENPLPKLAPGQPGNFSVTPGANGALTAEVAFTVPDVTVSGTALSGNVDLEVKRISANGAITQVEKLAGKTPGEALSVTDNLAASGLYTYIVIPSNSEGAGRATLPIEKWVGVDAPGQVTGLKASKKGDGYDIEVSWSSPAQGEHGGWFDASDLSYKIVRLPDNSVMESSTKATSYTDTSITSLEGYTYQVFAMAGGLTGPFAETMHVVSGPALEVPQKFSFSTSRERNLWSGVPNSLGDNWEDYCYTGIGLWCKRYYPLVLEPETKDFSCLVSPPIELKKDLHYLLKFDLRAYGDLIPVDFSVSYGETPGKGEYKIIDKPQMTEANLSFEPMSVLFSPSAEGAFCFNFNVDNLSPLWVANVSIAEVPEYELKALGFEGPQLANVGTASTYTVQLQNTGYADITALEVNLCDESGKVLATTKVADKIEPMAEFSVSMEWTPEAEGSLAVHAEAQVTGQDAAVSSKAIDVSVVGPGHWVTIGDIDMESGVSPFYLNFPHSWDQSIFTADEMGAQPGQIHGLLLYYNIIDSDPQGDFEAEVMFANTDKTEFAEGEMLEEAELTPVWSGTVSLASRSGVVAMLFDKPFQYDGRNLVMASRQSNTGGFTNSLRWICAYGKQYAGRTVYYRGEEPYQGTPTGLLQEIPKVSLWRDGKDSVGSLEASSAELVSTEYITLQGVKVSKPEKGLYIRLRTYSDGSFRCDKVMTDR